MRTRLTSTMVLLVTSAVALPVAAADSASGSVVVKKDGTIAPRHAAAYTVRDQRNARTTRTEVLLADVAFDPAALRAALDPHMVAINLDPLRDRNYILLWINADGTVSMNATFSKTMTQYINDSAGGLKTEWTTRSASRVEGRIFSTAPLKTMDGTTYTVDLKIGVDLPVAAAGTPLPAGGGDPGKAFTTFFAAAAKKDWNAIKAGSSPDALKMFDKSYNTPAENAEGALDLLKAWIPEKAKVTKGELRGSNTAILEVEGDLFPGTPGLSLVQMVKTGPTWQFDRAVRAGMVR